MFRLISRVFVALLCFLVLYQQQCLATTACCEHLQAALENYVFSPDQAVYKFSIKTYWSQQQQSVTPSCIVSPQNTQDVSKAIEVLSQYQESSDCKFAIRGAGHTPWAGSANIDGGVTIDMTSINAVNVNPDQTFVSVGAGARWSDVYPVLDAVGLGVAGGRLADVGVGGLVLGGGMSYFAPRYGFVCDQVVNYEIVLANGTAVNANATANTDLWFSLKGGSNNFGVVTRFDLKTFPQGKLWGGSICNTIDTLPAQIQAFVDFTNTSKYDINTVVINSYTFITQFRSWFVSNLLVYTEHEEYPPVLRPFADMKPQLDNTMRLTNLSDLTSEQESHAPYGLRQLFLTRTYGVNAVFLNQVFQIANTTLQTFANASDLVYSLVYQPLPSVITAHGAANSSSPNALGLDPDVGPQVLALQSIQWGDAADDARINEAARSIWAQADELAVSMGLQRKWIFMNYASHDQDPIGSYGDENVVKLQATSRKYDPTGLFQTSVPGGFKLFNRNDTTNWKDMAHNTTVGHVRSRRGWHHARHALARLSH